MSYSVHLQVTMREFALRSSANLENIDLLNTSNFRKVSYIM